MMEGIFSKNSLQRYGREALFVTTGSFRNSGDRRILLRQKGEPVCDALFNSVETTSAFNPKTPPCYENTKKNHEKITVNISNNVRTAVIYAEVM